MEAVRHDSLIPELGAPCPACKEPAPRLKLDHDRADVTGASDGGVQRRPQPQVDRGRVPPLGRNRLRPARNPPTEP